MMCLPTTAFGLSDWLHGMRGWAATIHSSHSHLPSSSSDCCMCRGGWAQHAIESLQISISDAQAMGYGAEERVLTHLAHALENECTLRAAQEPGRAGSLHRMDEASFASSAHDDISRLYVRAPDPVQPALAGCQERAACMLP